MSYLSADVAQRYILAVCERAGLRVVWEKTYSPRTDGHTIWLPYPDPSWGDAENDKLRNSVKHEASHILYSDFDVTNEKRPAKMLMFLWNLVEDHRVDFLNDTMFSGDLRLSERVMERWYEGARERIENPATTLFAWDFYVRADTWRGMASIADGMDGINPTMLAALRKYDGDVRTVRTITDKTKGTLATYDVAIRILRELFPDEEESVPKNEEDGEGEGEKGKGEKGDAGDEGDGSASGSGEEGDKDAEGREGLSTTGTSIGISDSDMPTAPHESSRKVPAPETGKEGSYTATPYNEIEVVRQWTTPWMPEEYKAQLLRELNKPCTMAHKLRQKLQVMSKDRRVYGQKSGALHAGSLHRLASGAPNAERVFTKRVHSEVLDCAVTLLLDCSGSMWFETFKDSAIALTRIKDALQTSLRLPVEVLGFTETVDSKQRHVIYEFQPFGQNISNTTLVDRLACADLGNNVDGESILYAYNRLVQRREKRRVMFVLSDGEPCGGLRKGSVSSHTRAVIDEVEKAGTIDLYGIGLGYSGVSHWYKNSATIDNLDMLDVELLRIVEKTLF